MPENEYLFSETEFEEERLKRLNEVYNPVSTEILSRYVQEGMHVLEIGLGTGEMAEWMSQQIGASGSYTGLDIGDTYFTALQEKLPTARLIKASVLDEAPFEAHFSSQKFDLIYLRWVLSYTPSDKFQETLGRLYRYLAPGGYLICEEFDLHASHCVSRAEPSSKVSVLPFNKWLELSLDVEKKLQANFKLGSQIVGLLTQVTEDSAEISSVTYQPAFQTERHKEVLFLGMKSARSTLLKNELKRIESYDVLTSELGTLAKNDDIHVKYIEDTVAIARKK